jgi:hypothetical protein
VNPQSLSALWHEICVAATGLTGMLQCAMVSRGDLFRERVKWSWFEMDSINAVGRRVHFADDTVMADLGRTEDPYESLSARTPEDRIRAILGLRKGRALPDVNDATMLKYYQYLSSRLTFPFEAQYSSETEPVVYPTTVVGLADPRQLAADPFVGLCCIAQIKNKAAVLPLVDIEVAEDSPNFRFIEDFWFWIWNWRDVCSQRGSVRPK